MSAIIDDALCLRYWEWSETSQTAALFTREHGSVRVLAKGSRRPKAPYSGGLELLTRAEAGFIIRPRSDLALLTYWDQRQVFPALRTVLAAHNAGLFIADMIFNFVRDHDPHVALFEATIVALERLTSAECVPAVLAWFQWRLLDECGFRPELDADVRTGEALANPLDNLVFDAAAGGVASPAQAPPASEAGVWRVRPETIALLRTISMSAAPFAVVEAAGGVGGAQSFDRASRLLASYARHVLGSEPPTMGALFGDGLAR